MSAVDDAATNPTPPVSSARFELNNPPVIADSVDGEAVAIDLDSGTYYSLAASAGVVWEAVLAGASVDHLASGRDEADTAALTTFVGSLLEQGLLRASAESAVAPAAAPAWAAAELAVVRFTDMQDLLGLDPIHDADAQVGWPVAGTGA